MPRRIWPVVVVFLASCTATARVPDGIEFRSENWYQAAESGFVVAPTAEEQVVTEGGQAAATFTNHLYFELRASMPGTPLESPERALYLLAQAEDGAIDRLAATRTALVLREPLDPDTLAALSRDLQHRYLLVTWVVEGLVEGIDDTAFDDYTTVLRSEEVRRYAYERVYGQLVGAVVDLWQNEVLWRGWADYQTASLYGEDGAIFRELERSRRGGAIRFADFLGRL